MSQKNNCQIKKDIQKLRQEKTEFRNKSLDKFQIKRKIGAKLSNDILSNVKPVERYGQERYLLLDIKKYIAKLSNGNKIFIELVGGQSSFLPPVGKHKQGKLFIKQ